jgi:hypothetical protein
MKSAGSLRGQQRPYKRRESTIEAGTLEPILRWRDIQHPARMKSGVCMACFGFVDDPRHTERLASVLGFRALGSIFGLRA